MVIKQVLYHPGAYDNEEAAAHAYDLAALKYWGQDTILNFPVLNCILKNFLLMYDYMGCDFSYYTHRACEINLE